ncbi:hypothetical protein STEG23_034274, partial [Scotinomys teguina]
QERLKGIAILWLIPSKKELIDDVELTFSLSEMSGPVFPTYTIRISQLYSIAQARISLCSPGCPGTCSVDQTELELRDPLESVRLKGSTTTAIKIFHGH